jgi:hypothetical protein
VNQEGRNVADKILFWVADNVLPWVLIAIGAALFIAPICLFIAGLLEKPLPLRGTIVQKDHREAHSQQTFAMVGKIMVPQTHHYPATWSVLIQPEGTTNEDARRLAYVNREYWEACRVGDAWERGRID